MTYHGQLNNFALRSLGFLKVLKAPHVHEYVQYDEQQ